MKYIITENNLRNFLKREFNLDLTRKVDLIKRVELLPKRFYNYRPRNAWKDMIKRHISTHVLEYNNQLFLIFQENNGTHQIYEWMDNQYEFDEINENQLFDILGIPPIISLSDILNTYSQDRTKP